MAVRAVWILSLGTTDNVLYSRKFPTVERLAQRNQNTSFVAIPSDNEFSKSLLEALALDGTSEFQMRRDDCQKECKLPVVEVSTKSGNLGPVILIDQFGVFFCCLTFDKCSANETLKPIEMPSTSLGFTMLTQIINFVGPSIASCKSNASKIMQLDTYISLSMPFGKPTNIFPDSLIQPSSQPWKAGVPAGKSAISFQIMETVRSMQHPQNETPQLQLYGTISMKTELEEYRYDIGMKLTDEISDRAQEFQSLVYHPCIQTSSAPHREKIYTMNLMNQPQSIVLFHYMALPQDSAPITGIYRMRETEALQIELRLQLFLNPRVKNNFDTLEAWMPFYSRGKIESIDGKPTGGTISLVENKSTLQWDIGSSFPLKTLEHCLNATLKFTEKDDSAPLRDPFCTGANAYAQIKIKQTGMTLSSTKVVFNNISPMCKPKITYDQEVKSSDYKIWNEFGKIPFPKMV